MRIVQRLCLFLLLALVAFAQDEPVVPDQIVEEEDIIAVKRPDPKAVKQKMDSFGGGGAGGRFKNQIKEVREQFKSRGFHGDREELREMYKKFRMMRRSAKEDIEDEL